MRWNKITLVGVGLLGGSLGLAARQRGLATNVVGYVRREASVPECQRLGIVAEATLDLIRAVEAADLIVLCTPLAQMRVLAERMLPALKRGAIVTDVGSAKAGVVKALEPIIRQAGAHFIGSHPLAGSEKMGARAARADLFENTICILTPTAKSSRAAVRKVEAFWQAVGARTLRLAPAAHDTLVSRSSHLPHLVACQLVNYVLHPARPPQQALLCASGFRDTTRIASGSPEMWRDIALANRRALGRALDAFIQDLRRCRSLLKQGQTDALMKFFQTAKARRDAWQAASASE